jgi:hypothetical protein
MFSGIKFNKKGDDDDRIHQALKAELEKTPLANTASSNSFIL